MELEEQVGAPSISLTFDKKQNAEIKYANGLLEKIIDRKNQIKPLKELKLIKEVMELMV